MNYFPAYQDPVTLIENQIKAREYQIEKTTCQQDRAILEMYNKKDKESLERLKKQ